MTERIKRLREERWRAMQRVSAERARQMSGAAGRQLGERLGIRVCMLCAAGLLSLGGCTPQPEPVETLP